ncbi:MAG: tetratricopeptide repeat protein, partial [Salibacteraceae bacterium]
MKTLGWIIGLCCVAFSSLWAQPVESLIEAGNTSYKAGAYAAADSTYQEALNIAPESYEGAFNRGDALYRQQEYEEAANTFRQLATTTQDPKRKAAAYHNLGNSLFQEKNLEGSIEAYKNALRNDPTDADTRYNLALAQKLLKEQQQNEENKDDQDQEDQEEKDDQEEQQDQENKDDQE